MKATFFSSVLYKVFGALMIVLLVIMTALPVTQARAAVTAQIVPTATGFYNTWQNGVTTIDEGTAAASCVPLDSIATTIVDGRESYVIPLTSVPDGSTITSIDVLIRDKGDLIAGGTYASFIRLNGVNSASSATHTVTGAGNSDPCTDSFTDTFDIADTVKGASTTLEIGVIKLDVTRLRVGVLSAVITYNTRPTAGNGAVTTNEDTLYTFTTADFTTLTTPAYSDPESDPLSGIQVTSLETAGTLQCGGVDVALNGTCANVTTLTFLPASNANGSSYATFGFKVYDGSFYSASSYTMTVDVTAVNDAPSFTATNPPTVAINSGAQTVNSWATFNAGPNEVGQGVLQYNISNSTCGALLSAGPSVSTAGTLTYMPAPGQTGTCTFDVTVQDDGGTANGGTDTSSPVQTFTITIDSAVGVTIDQAAGQSDPTNVPPINFTVVFSAPTTNFATGDVTLGGTAGATTATVTGSGMTYNVAVSGMTSNGTVIATIAAGVATDAASNPNSASTSTDNTVTFDLNNPAVASTSLTTSYTGTGPGNFTVTFNKAIDDPAGNTSTDDVTNPANYLLVNKGTNEVANTVSCAGGVVADDTQLTVTSVSYSNVTFQATVTLAGPLPVGSYRLFICGTTSIVDLAGNPLNGGTDYTFDFVVRPTPQQSGGNNNQQNTLLPATGFPHNKITVLPIQPAEKAYSSTDLWLEIPKLGIKMPIVGVPTSKNGWNVSWLDKNAGWLNGSAYPTWSGNSVLTGHVWDALNQPGPFVQLKSLKYGDQVKIHAFGQVYIYEITENTLVYPSNATTVFKHADKPVITLITCEDYKEASETYSTRRMVRAALVSVTTEK